MTHESMTVHRAMVELKTIDKRIAKEIEGAAFCTSAKVNMKKLFGQPAEEFYRQAQSDFDSITGLINRAAAIKAAIPVSNAKTKIKVNEQEMTVAEAISLKQNLIPLRQKLLNALNIQYSEAIHEVEDKNATLEKRTDAYIASIYGSNAAAKAADAEEVNKARDAYANAQTFELVDGLKSNKKGTADIIKAMQDDIVKFQNDLDAALSVSNATTTIEIDY